MKIFSRGIILLVFALLLASIAAQAERTIRPRSSRSSSRGLSLRTGKRPQSRTVSPSRTVTRSRSIRQPSRTIDPSASQSRIHSFRRPSSNIQDRTHRSRIITTKSSFPSQRVNKSTHRDLKIDPRPSKSSVSQDRSLRVYGDNKRDDYHRRSNEYRDRPRDPDRSHHNRRHDYHSRRRDYDRHKRRHCSSCNDWGFCYSGDNYSIWLGGDWDNWVYPSWCGSDYWQWSASYYTDDLALTYTSGSPRYRYRRVWVPGYWKTVYEREQCLGPLGFRTWRTVRRKVWVPGYWKVCQR